MEESYFPLRWESTGDQWWYASPIDCAAANGQYDIVRELLHLDSNLLIKLTSLRRIRRLETVWDDDARFIDAAKCRAFVARRLLLECETKNNRNTLLRAGYGGWLIYTAASAGDMGFVQELLDRDPVLVFGEGEYGVTDIFYAAARSKSLDIFRLLLDFAMSPRCLMVGRGGEPAASGSHGSASIFRLELLNRAVHAAARGGNLEMLTEILDGCSDVLAYGDAQGSTILHSASGRGQVQVVKYLVASFDIIYTRDNQGNTGLHIAAFRGHLPVVEALIAASPPSISSRNNTGDTFLHMAVAGFRTPGFRRLDRQMELMRQLITGTVADISEIINARNNDGQTVLHTAVIAYSPCDLIELLITVRSINVNIQDAEGMTPLDLLRRQPRSASSEILTKQLVSAGGISYSRQSMRRLSVGPQLRVQCIGSSPGTYFKVSDSEIFLLTGVNEISGRPSSCSTDSHELSDKQLMSAVNKATRHLKILLKWPHRKEKKPETPPKKTGGDDDSLDSLKKLSQRIETPTPLRQRFSKMTTLPNNKRALAVRGSMPSPATKKKFAAGLRHGVIQAMPHLAAKQKGVCVGDEAVDSGASCSNAANKSGFVNSKLMNQYFCFGAQGLAVEDSESGKRSSRMFRRPFLSVA